ncbi:MAG: hypothetical protein AVDCRST_MAG89-1721 [uncultured Gemmatimonadetes bacterium]|uniref:Uncharacterized protein n=1 Tax=uncultured Gemmatimonadota bacterium TaxID=203437 RepID=A0A6J4L368_9BACT|nr:MAG: hypothetical protein AVDCRST_MAG89-1721 [uncultured Gemmatimonadota bacterium]
MWRRPGSSGLAWCLASACVSRVRGMNTPGAADGPPAGVRSWVSRLTSPACEAEPFSRGCGGAGKRRSRAAGSDGAAEPRRPASGEGSRRPG